MRTSFTFLFIFYSVLVFAQKDTVMDLQDVNIVANRPVSAASSEYISRIDFENRPKNSGQDMLKMVPGLFIAQHAGGGKAEQIFIRGFDCDHGTDAAMFVDGVPVNMPSHGHGQGYADLHFLIPEVVERMDVFKGPYNPRYGDFATAAAVNFNTLDAIPDNLFQIESAFVPRTNKLSAKRALFLYKLPLFSSKVNSYVAFDALNNRSYFDLDQKFNRYSFFSKTNITITDHSILKFSIGGFNSSWDASGQIPERAVSQGIITRFGSIDSSEGGNTYRNNFNIVYNSHNQSSELVVQAFLFNYDFRLFSNFTFYKDDPVNGDEIEQDDHRITGGTNVQYSIYHLLGNLPNKFTIGLSHRSDEIENQLWHVKERTRLDVRAHANILVRSNGIFINETFHFSNSFRAEAAMRFDYFSFDVDDLIPDNPNHSNYSGKNYQALISPKLNLIYSPDEKVNFFLNSGIGFHSNDARSVVQEPNQHQLPRVIGAELGSLFHAGNNFITSASLWWMESKSELVYVGDDGTTEDKGPARRIGIDLSIRKQINKWLNADIDLNAAHCRLINEVFGDKLRQNYFVPLAPVFSSTGGLTAKIKKVFEAGLRYRYLSSRPANESNTIRTRSYNVIDFSSSYRIGHVKTGLIIENITNTEWNEAQFETESQLKNESVAVDELNFTPGTPLSIKILIGYQF